MAYTDQYDLSLWGSYLPIGDYTNGVGPLTIDAGQDAAYNVTAESKTDE